jgi:hypothetical protein
MGYVDDKVLSNALELLEFRMLHLQLLNSSFQLCARLVEFSCKER